MSVYPKFNRDMSFSHGEENTVASFHKWIKDLFAHPDGYEVVFDKDGTDFLHKKQVKFPCIVVQQLDTVDEASRFMGGRANMAKLMFYIYVHHHMKYGGSRRTLRRSRDQVSYALRGAGIRKIDDSDFYVDPIYILDFRQPTPVPAGGVLTVERGIQQRFIQDGEIISYEFMVTLDYVEQM